jgi:hypothetical protein
MRPWPMSNGDDNPGVLKAAKMKMIDAADRYVLQFVLAFAHVFSSVLKHSAQQLFKLWCLHLVGLAYTCLASIFTRSLRPN